MKTETDMQPYCALLHFQIHLADRFGAFILREVTCK